MDRGEAFGLAEDAFPGVFGAQAFKRFELPLGLRVKEFLGDSGAVLEAQDERDNRLVESMGVPLTSELGSGRPGFVDLALEREPDGFAPRNPAVPTRISAGGSVRVGPVGIGVANMNSGDDPVSERGRLFFANGLTDTDVVVAPTLRGASFAFQVRSAEAPEQATLDLDLPADASLREAPVPGSPVAGVEVLREGKVIGRISPPVAWDRDEEPVAVSYTVEGDRVIIQFPHRDKDVRYPLYVDPNYDYYGPYFAAAWGDGWTFRQNGGAGYSYTFGTAPQPARLWNFLGYFPHGSWANLEWQNPRGYITNLYGGSLSHFHAWTCGRFGITREDIWAGWKTGYPAELPCYKHANAQYPEIVNASDTSYRDRAVLQLFMEGTGTRNWSGSVEMYGTRVEVADIESPTVAGNAWDLPNSTGGGWVRPGDNVSISATATDAGLGMAAFNLFLPTGAATKWVTAASPPTVVDSSQQAQACTGLRGSRCPLDAVTANYGFDAGIYATGVHQITGAAYDRLNKPKSFYTTVKVDGTAPTAGSISGELMDAAQTGTPLRGTRTYTLTANADDPHSGLAGMDVFVDGQRAPATSTAAGGPTMRLDWTMNPRDYQPGSHTITVRAADAVGNSRETHRFSVEISTIGFTPRLGINLGPSLDEGTPGEMSSTFDAKFKQRLLPNHIRFVRVKFNMWKWESEGKAWTRWDNFMNVASANGIHVLPILVYDDPHVAWVDCKGFPQTGKSRVPRNGTTAPVEYTGPATGAWRTFVAQAVARYRPGGTRNLTVPVQAWEIWNEPNFRYFFEKRPDAAYYRTAVLRPAYEEIKVRDADATVVIGGLAENGQNGCGAADDKDDQGAAGTFLGALASSTPHYFDAVNIHPYTTNLGSGAPYDPPALFWTLFSIWQQMDLNNVDPQTPVWVTEYGWSVLDKPDSTARCVNSDESFGVRYVASGEADQAAKTAAILDEFQRHRNSLSWPIGPQFAWPGEGNTDQARNPSGKCDWAQWSGLWTEPYPAGTDRPALAEVRSRAATPSGQLVHYALP